MQRCYCCTLSSIGPFYYAAATPFALDS